MTDHYEIVIVTHLPAFYKVNLYNELSKSKRILVIFLGQSSNIRPSDFTDQRLNFPFTYINRGTFESRNIFKSLLLLILQLKKISYNHIIVNGWELPEFWLSIFFKRGEKGLALESSELDSKSTGPMKIAKQIFLSKITFVLPSGSPHVRLLNKLGYKGKIFKTCGVGLSNKLQLQPIKEPQKVNKFIYVGRLSKEKNLDLLISVFNKLPQFELTIIGSGPLEKELKIKSGTNISFLGYIPNRDLVNLFKKHQVLILPSLSEPWGLVIEEILRFGIPVIVSDRVGCHEDIVINLNTGLIFKAESLIDLQTTIITMSDINTYKMFKKNISNIEWDKINKMQIAAYSCDFV